MQGVVMEKRALTRLGLMTALLAVFVGCTAAISKPLRDQADPNIGVRAVRENPQAYVGETLVWGGRIIDTTPLAAATRVKVLQKPLDYRLEPRSVDVSEGRFLSVYEGFLDPEIYGAGRYVTVAGELTGTQSLPLGETRYPYPVIKVREIHLWPPRPDPAVEDYYRWYPYPYPFRPWGYHPYWW
jgi:outer membrane lipoprotein